MNNITVISNGAFGQAIAGQIAWRGGKVSLLDPFSEERFNKLKASKKIKLTGIMDIEVPVDKVLQDFESLDQADLIIVTVAAASLEAITEKIAKNVRSGQHLVLFPGCFGAMVLKDMIGKNTGIRDITVSEAVSAPYVCDLAADNSVRIHKLKNELKLATCPAVRNAEVIEILNYYLDIFVAAANYIETSLENINSVIHPLPILLNLVELERKGKSFKHFIDGINSTVSRLIEEMDQERIAVGEAYSLSLVPALEQLKSYYGWNDSMSIFEYVNGPDSPYRDIAGYGLDSRYISDDIPYLAVAVNCLGKVAGVKTPIFDVCIQLASIINGRDYHEAGNNLQKLRVEGMTKEEILQAVCKL